MSIDWNVTPAAIWRSRTQKLKPVSRVESITFDKLLGIDTQIAQIKSNTERFLKGMPANNVLLWGARGTGKSSLIKALLNEFMAQGLRIIQIDRDDLAYLPEIVDEIQSQKFKYIVFCDDLSFDRGDRGYKSLKSTLEGSIEMPPENLLIYATSNRRHLLPEYMHENQSAHLVNTEIHYSDATEEKISLSDRFGLLLSFHPINQEQYLLIVDSFFSINGHELEHKNLHKEAIRFALEKGVRSGRTAQQFYKSKYHDSDSA